MVNRKESQRLWSAILKLGFERVSRRLAARLAMGCRAPRPFASRGSHHNAPCSSRGGH